MASNRRFIMRTLAVIAIILAIVYIIMPIDFDGPMVGIIDDFFIFMAAFCFCQSQFISPSKISARRSLSIISLIFLILGIIWVGVLAFSPIQDWVA